MRSWSALGRAAVAAMALAGCAWLGEARREPPSDGIDVVQEQRGEFDPSEAVRDGAVEELPSTEDLSTETEVAREERLLEQRVEHADRSEAQDDGAAKASLARNPTPDGPGPTESPPSAILDLALEALLVALLALIITALQYGVAHHPLEFRRKVPQ